MMCSFSPRFVDCESICHLCNIMQRAYFPTLRHLPNLRLLRRLAARAMREEMLHQRRLALALQLQFVAPGLDGVLHGLQDVGDGALLGKGREI